ncbi:hypothetical protein [Cupriavidus campinensis]|uniref:PepSY domain-containing protein n=1 Tax=Cupriavidus campinensis TaxID=151783 RepID=A0ABY3ETE6_9BURK|nr:hypothetical protein [Cupriavidus campinensis]TSP13977.1 hypothetical protein FGG12_05770 [Cupriavidus campinensis]
MEVTQIVGLTKTEAMAVLVRQGIPHRVVQEDGKGKLVTADVRSERANLTIVDGKVTEVSYG